MVSLGNSLLSLGLILTFVMTQLFSLSFSLLSEQIFYLPTMWISLFHFSYILQMDTTTFAIKHTTRLRLHKSTVNIKIPYNHIKTRFQQNLCNPTRLIFLRIGYRFSYYFLFQSLYIRVATLTLSSLLWIIYLSIYIWLSSQRLDCKPANHLITVNPLKLVQFSLTFFKSFD